MLTKKDKAAGRTTFPRYTPEELDAHTLLLVKTGSHLYGVATKNSDHDYWRVVTEEQFSLAVGIPKDNKLSKAHKVQTSERDEMFLSVKTFERMLSKGVPQALEMIFAENPIIDKMPDFRRAFRAPMNGDMLYRYMSKIRKDAYRHRKMRRDAIRLSLNLREAMLNGGRFNPTLTEAEVKLVKRGVDLPPVEFTALLDSLNLYSITGEDEWNIAEMVSVRAAEIGPPQSVLW